MISVDSSRRTQVEITESRCSLKYKVGQLVRNRKLGLGRILELHGDEVLAYFKDEQVNPRRINVVAVPMEIPSNQADEFFDSLSDQAIAKLSKPVKPRATKARKAKVEASA
jgi:hypothetical protein